jgi:hypothetical protein
LEYTKNKEMSEEYTSEAVDSVEYPKEQIYEILHSFQKVPKVHPKCDYIKRVPYKFVLDGSQIYNSKSEWVSEEMLKDNTGALRIESSSTIERYILAETFYIMRISSIMNAAI